MNIWYFIMVMLYALPALFLPVLRSDDVQHDTLSEKGVVKLQEDGSEGDRSGDGIWKNKTPEPAPSLIYISGAAHRQNQMHIRT